ncbi:group-specific protein [Planomicrobium sp. Y74]|uniref:WD40/YVTN/BNR-like repeat-containing protein n=1 Tax=Planomicrobium sp. Y74 TaxID=2478977 RepID=UPI00256FE6E6|nr:group-specific protein [Planomicrobium sp. Y74]
MAVGYNSHDIFLLNPAKNSLLEAGFYKSNDEGVSWEPVIAAGLAGEVTALALPPTDSDFVAAATAAGVYFSSDGGEGFEMITAESETGTALHFTEDSLYFGSYGTTASLIKYTIENEELEPLNIPDLPEDAIAFIAQNPNDESELAIYTLQDQAYLSEDGSQTWEALLQDDKTD